MRTITFQVGVDILGFPMYVTHYVSESKNKFNNKPCQSVTVENSKQH